MNRMQLLLSISAGLLALTLSAYALASPVIEEQRVPGGVAIVDIGTADEPLTQVRWNRRELATVTQNGRRLALVGLPLSIEPGEQQIVVNRPGQSISLISFSVDAFPYEEQRLTIKNKRKVNPAPMDMERIQRENTRLKVVKSYRSDRWLANSFDWPLPGPISSPFGLRRFYNNQPRRPHGGIDIAAPEGTRILAPADGVVVETGDYFFNGNCVFIEHGHGLQTFYAHLSEIHVEPGQRISKGELLGKVGQTGRVTGPHLHWSVGLNQTWINPLLLLAEDTPPAAE